MVGALLVLDKKAAATWRLREVTGRGEQRPGGLLLSGPLKSK